MSDLSCCERVTIGELQKRVHKCAIDHGWWEGGDRNFGEQLALMHSELSEALEEYRDKKPIAYSYRTPVAPDKPQGIPSELADVIIRILDTCEWYGVDIEAAILEKVAYNETRPYRHGGKVC